MIDISKINRNRIIAIAIVCAVIVLLSVGFFIMIGSASPKKSLLEIKQAIKNNDLEKFERYVDLENFFDKGFEAYVMADMKKRGINFTKADLEMAGMMRGMIVPTLVMTARDAVKTGDPSFSKLGNYDDFGVNGWEYKSTGSARKKGKTAIVPITVRDNQLDRDFVFNIKFAKTDEGIWQVKELENATALIAEREAAVKEKLDELNAQIFTDMNKAVVLTEPKTALVKTTGYFSSSYSLTCKFTAKNMLDKDISNMSVSMTIFDESDKNIYTGTWRARDLKARKEKEFSIKESLNKYIENEEKIIDTGLSGKKAKLEIRSISLADGTEINLLRELPPYVKN